jgi:integrase
MRTPDKTRAQIAALPHGRHRISQNLYLEIGPRSRSWVFNYHSPLDGKRHEMGLGSCELIGLAAAKALALKHRAAIAEGRDPLQERRAGRAERKRAVSFRKVAELYIAAHEAGWRSKGHRAQWGSSLESYVYPVMADVAVDVIDTGLVMQALSPIWTAKPETGSRVRARIEAVLDFAKSRGWRTGENAAAWKGHLANLLPARSKVRAVKHHPALGWRELPALWGELDARSDMAAMVVKFVLLTAARPGEAIGATWSEIDQEARLWRIPAERMKAGREHKVPLSAPALALLTRLAAARQNDFVFPGSRRNKSISETGVRAAFQQLRPGMTLHGSARSGFADWGVEHQIGHELREAALAHVVESKTERAYRRGDLFESRRKTMADWAAFLAAPTAEVVPLRAGRALPAKDWRASAAQDRLSGAGGGCTPARQP